jgi:RHS repeat-associated protein
VCAWSSLEKGPNCMKRRVVSVSPRRDGFLTILALTCSLVAACGSKAKEAPAPKPAKVPAPIDLEQSAQALATTPTPQALLIVGTTTLAGGDLKLRDRLVTLGFNVSAVAGSAAVVGDATGKTLVVISESVTDTQVAAKFKPVTVPVMVLEPLLFDDMGFTTTTTTDFSPPKTGQSQITILTSTHAMAAGLSATQTVLNAGATATFGWGKPAGTVDKIASIVGTATQVTVFGYATGAPMNASSPAAARRVGWFASQAAFDVMSANGWTLFDAAVRWVTLKDAVLVTAATTPSTGEAALKTHLQAAPFNMVVRTMVASAATATSVVPAQLIVVSDAMSISAGQTVGTALNAVAVPILSLSAGSFGTLRLTGTTSGTDFGTTATQTTVNIVKAGHQLAAGLTGSVTIPSETVQWGKSVAAGAIKIATLTSDATKFTVFGFGKGATLRTTPAAPARRVGMFASSTALAAAATTAPVWKLFDAAATWAKDLAVDASCEGLADGAACSDANACTQTDTCQNQVCVGANPKTCATPPICQSATGATCNPTTGACVYTNLTNGTGCDDATMCNGRETCQAGVCTAGTAVTCNAPPTCQSATGATCNPANGVCTYTNVTNGTGCDDATMCNGHETCQAGACTAGTAVTCNSPPICHSATGATCNATTGACVYPNATNGTGCDDATLCNGHETCQAGACTAGTAVTCNAPPTCHSATGATCNAATGACVYPNATNGTGCDDATMCNGHETCQTGACTAGTAVTCNSPPACQSATGATCNPANGVCTYTNLTNGSACDDATLCNGRETCQAGACTAGTAVTCNSPPTCRTAAGATCNASTGACSYPNATNGTSCDDSNACTDTDQCTNGSCAGAPKTCNDNDTCTTDSCSGGICQNVVIAACGGPVHVTLDPAGYKGGLCIGACTDVAAAPKLIDLEPGTYQLQAPNTYLPTTGAADSSLGSVTIAGGKVNLDATALSYVTPSGTGNTVTLTAKTSPVTMAATGGYSAVGLYNMPSFTGPGATLTLLKNRRYRMFDSLSLDAVRPDTFFSAEPDLLVKDDGNIALIKADGTPATSSADVNASFLFPTGNTLTYNTSALQLLATYPGTIDFPNLGSFAGANREITLVRGRRYRMMDDTSYDPVRGDKYFTTWPDLLVQADGNAALLKSDGQLAASAAELNPAFLLPTGKILNHNPAIVHFNRGNFVGIIGLAGSGDFNTNSDLPLLTGRVYRLYDTVSKDTLRGDVFFSGVPDLAVNTNGSISLRGNAPGSFETPVGNVLAPKLGTMTLLRPASYTDPIGINGVTAMTTTGNAVGTVFAGRSYAVTPSNALVAFPPTGNDCQPGVIPPTAIEVSCGATMAADFCTNPANDGALCSGNVCGGGMACQAGACSKAVAALNCDDGNPCTAESCSASGTCSRTLVQGCVPAGSVVVTIDPGLFQGGLNIPAIGAFGGAPRSFTIPNGTYTLDVTNTNAITRVGEAIGSFTVNSSNPNNPVVLDADLSTTFVATATATGAKISALPSAFASVRLLDSRNAGYFGIQISGGVLSPTTPVVLLRGRRYRTYETTSRHRVTQYVTLSTEPDLEAPLQGPLKMVDNTEGQQIFDVINTDLSLKPSAVIDATYDHSGSPNVIYVEGYVGMSDIPTKLLRNRAYQLRDLRSTSLSDPARGTAISDRFDLETLPSGAIQPVPGTTAAALFMTAPGSNTKLIARPEALASVTYQANGSPMPLQLATGHEFVGEPIGAWEVVPHPTKGPTAVLLKDRRYPMMTWNGSSDLVTGSGWDPPIGYLEVQTNGSVTISGTNVSSQFQTSPGSAVFAAITAHIRITPPAGYAGSVCLYPGSGSFWGCGAPGGVMDTLVIPARQYLATPFDDKIRVDALGNCMPSGNIAGRGGTFILECGLNPTLQPPTNLQATVVSNANVTLSWTVSPSAVTGYRVERSSDNAATWALVTGCDVGQMLNTCADTSGIVAGMTYKYRAYAYNVGVQAYSNEVTVGFVQPLVDCAAANVAENTVCAGNACDGSVCVAHVCTPRRLMVGASCGSATGCNAGSICGTSQVPPMGVFTCVPPATSPVVSCDDNNPCTADACDVNGTCTHTVLAAGTSCGVAGANSCMSGMTCNAAGVCGGVGTPVACDDGNQCTVDTCAPGGGCASHAYGIGDPNPPASCVLQALDVCIVPQGQRFAALFTYRNASNFNVSFPVGTDNGFITAGDAAADMGQPRLFTGGDHGFMVSSSETGEPLQWKLFNKTLTATTSTQRCAMQPGALGTVAALGDVHFPFLIDPSRAIPNSIVATDSLTDAQGTPRAAGATPLGFDVTATGAASLSVPLWTPPGRNGLQPQITLSYSSQNTYDRGGLGRGWSFSGFSEIRRCAKTKLRDGAPGPIAFDDTDRFCLDGRYLVPLAGKPKEFRTEIDIFAKVTRLDDGSWEVRSRNGQISTYGTSEESRLEGHRTSTGPMDVLAWGVDQTRDRYGNHMTYAYDKPTYFYGVTDPVEVYLWRPIGIRYGGRLSNPDDPKSPEARAHDRAVSFQLSFTNDAPTFPQWISGFPTGSLKNYAAIVMTGGDGVTLRRYNLKYDLSWHPLQRLESIEECDAQAVCKLPTVFTWTQPSDTFEASGFQTATNLTPTGMENYWEMATGDFDGDGDDDIMYRAPNPASDHPPSQNSDYTTVNRERWKVLSPYTASNVVAADLPDRKFYAKYNSPIVIDLDRDGKSDVIQVAPASWESVFAPPTDPFGTPLWFEPQSSVSVTPAAWQWFRSVSDTANVAFTPGFAERRPKYTVSIFDQQTFESGFFVSDLFLADLDGDGFADLIRPALQPCPSGASPCNFVHWLAKRRKADGTFGPDVDLGLYAPESDTTAVTEMQSSTDSARARRAFTADLDGDGRTEFIYRKKAMDNSIKMFAANLDSSDHLQTRPTDIFPVERGYILGASLEPTNTKWFIDVTGDGLPDQVEVRAEGGVPAVQVNTGTNVRAADPRLSNATGGTPGNNYSPSNESIPREMGVRFADYDGDGATDLFLLDSNNERLPDVTGPYTDGDTPPRGERNQVTVWVARPTWTTGSNGAQVQTLTWSSRAPVTQQGTSAAQPIVPGVATGSASNVSVDGLRRPGFRLSQILDADGDGAMDIAMVYPIGIAPYAEGNLSIYRRVATAPLITQVVDGMGKVAKIAYEPLRNGSPAYTKSNVPADCSFPKSCSVRGKWVVTFSSTDNGTTAAPNLTPVAPAGAGYTNLEYHYNGAVTDLRGEGFLGFRSRSIVNRDTSKSWDISYDLDTVATKNGLHIGGGLPISEMTMDTVPNGTIGTSKTTTWNVANSPEFSDASVAAVRFGAHETFVWEIIGGYRGIFHTSGYAQYAGYFNEAVRSESTYLTQAMDGSDALKDLYERVVHSKPDLNNWLLDLPDPTEEFTVTETSLIGGDLKMRNYFIVPEVQAGGRVTGAIFQTRRLATDPLGKRNTTYFRNEEGFVTKVLVEGTETRTTTITPDSTGIFPQTIARGGLDTTLVYHPEHGVLALEIDSNGVATSHSYDGFLRPKNTATDRGDGASTTYRFQPGLFDPAHLANNPLQIETRLLNGGGARTTLDRLGRAVVESSLQSEGNAESWQDTFKEYYPEGGLHTFSKGDGPGASPKMTYVYDNANRLTSVTDFLDVATTQSYSGRTITTTEPGRITTTTVDHGGRTVSTTKGGVTTTLGYEPFGLLKTVTVGGVNQLTNEFDNVGRKTAVTGLNQGRSTFKYNENDELIWSNDANNTTMELIRDELGRIKERRNLTTGEKATYTWDAEDTGKGQLYSATSFDGTTTTNTYDQFGDLESEETKASAMAVSGFVSTYGRQQGRLTSVTYPAVNGSAYVVGYEYDAVSGQLKRAYQQIGNQSPELSPSLWQIQSRGKEGLAAAETLGPSLQTYTTRDENLRTTKILTFQGAYVPGLIETFGPKLQDLRYTYKQDGDLETRRHTLLGVTETFTYDDAGRLKTWEVGSGPKATYTYPPATNELEGRTSSGGLGLPTMSLVPFGSGSTTPTAIQTATFGSDALVYTYDPAGNQKSGDGRTINYTSFNLPKDMTLADGSASFRYDAFDQRAAKTVTRPGTGGTTEYHAGLYERRVNASNQTTHVLHVMAERHIADVVWPDGGAPEVLYLHRDALGSLETISAQDGTFRERRKYDPFGRRVSPSNLVSDAGPLLEAPHDGFTGHEEDAELGLINMRGRIYDPKTSRFLSTDPIVGSPFSGGVPTRYGYVGNDPLNATDPSGFDGEGGGDDPKKGTILGGCTGFFNCLGIFLDPAGLRHKVGDLFEHHNQDNPQPSNPGVPTGAAAPKAPAANSVDPSVDATGGGQGGGAYDVTLRSYAPFTTFGGGFGGDTRGPTTSLDVTSRVSSTIAINPMAGTAIPGRSFDGVTTWGPFSRAGNPRFSFASTRLGSNGGVAFAYSVAGSNGITSWFMGPLSPDIDRSLNLRATVMRGNLNISGSVTGDAFPNAEVFITDAAGNSRMLGTPFWTSGGANFGPLLYLPGEGTATLIRFSTSIPLGPGGLFK